MDQPNALILGGFSARFGEPWSEGAEDNRVGRASSTALAIRARSLSLDETL